MYRQTTKQRAQGKWTGIISHICGEQATSRKHGPCPICGGKDRYRYDNKNGNGDWYCNVCGVGDGFRLLQETLGVDFAEAARQVDRLIATVPLDDEPFKPDIDIKKRQRNLNTLWKNAKAPQFAIEYLRHRGIPEQVIKSLTSDVRGIESCWHSGDACHYPAMLALIRSPKGKPVSIHRTYIGAQDNGKKIMPPIETINGGYVKLGEPDKHLVIAEGIETALAASAVTNMPAWATISAHGMEQFKTIPRHVESVIIVADNDHSFTGQAAAFKCAANLRNRKGIATQVWMPAIEGDDMLDTLSRPTWHGGASEILKWRGK